jgi:hypothetical protein
MTAEPVKTLAALVEIRDARRTLDDLEADLYLGLTDERDPNAAELVDDWLTGLEDYARQLRTILAP